MEKPGGGFAWADKHNSRFELCKLLLIYFPRPRTLKHNHPPPLTRGTKVAVKTSTRMLGIMLDSKLSWKEQLAYAHSKASKIVSALWKLSRPSNGISMLMMRRLYIPVVIPR